MIALLRKKVGAVPLAAVPLLFVAAACGEEGVIENSARGSGGSSGETAVRDAYIVPALEPGTCVIQRDGTAQLHFTVTNSSSRDSERLTEISTPAAGAVELPAPGMFEIAAQASLAMGQPIEQPDDPQAPDQPLPAAAVQQLDESARPGTSVPVTFVFERAGEVTFNVPVESCPAQPTSVVGN
jgi:hypothetical protein